MISFGIISAEHFWHEMDGAELEAVIRACQYREYNDWLHTRQICYTLAQVNSRKRINIENFMKLTNPLEKAEAKAKPEAPDMEALRAMSRRYEAKAKAKL